jgi:hypothetical protein
MSDLIVLPYPLNETTNNIIQVSKKIKKIPNYTNYYNTILNYHYSSKQQQIWMTQPKIQSIDFITYFKQHNSLINIIDTYESLLESLHLLHQQNILYNGFFIFFDSSIIFKEPLHIPIINEFTYAIDYDFVSICSTFLDDLDLSTPMPPELYVIAYMSKNNITSLSQYDIDQMKHIIGIDYLMNKPYEYIINSLTENKFKWDVYGLTMLFLHLIHHHINYKHKYFDIFITQLEKIIELGGVSTEDAKKQIQSIIPNV